ncbi:MAG: ABC transporter ATP-binding protein [Pseudomonadota bacterium]|nr:ABC transporter ATP-binding protein [Pseudomonadota bacterium]
MTNAIAIESLTKVFEDGNKALNEVDLIIPKGSFFALLGHNGAGKTTLIKSICQLTSATSGDIWVKGKNLKNHSMYAKRAIGLVPQEFNCNPFHTVEQILYQFGGYQGLTKSQIDKKIPKLLENLYLTEKRKTLFRSLSGGMKRAVTIARALIHEPDILFLDEPTAGVDVEIREGMWRFFKALNKKGLTIVLTTHYLEEAEQLCKEMALINRGKIIITGEIKKLLADQECAIIELSVDHMPDVTKLPSYIHKKGRKGLRCHLPSNIPIHDVFDTLNKLGCRVDNFEVVAGRLEQLIKQSMNRKAE